MTGPLLLLLAALTVSPELPQSLDALEREVGRLRSLEVTQPSTRKDPAQDLETLRRQWITRKTFDLLSKRYETPDNASTPKTNAEIAFRLARHAFLLRKLDDSKTWIERIGNLPETSEWTSKGLYLSGLIELRSGAGEQAAALFTSSMTKAPKDSETVTLCMMALARLAFDQGRYTDAQALYAAIPKGSPSYEDSLQESAWNDVRLKKPDRAATNLDLLFTLYPESRRLPEAGFLLGNVIETEQGLAEKAKALDNLVIRLAFEADATKNALAAYSGHEEHVLSDIDVTLHGLRLRAILPPIGHRLLEREPVFAAHLAHLRELQDDQDELEESHASLEAIRFALKGDSATTIDEVVVLEWANSLERRISGLPQADSFEPGEIGTERTVIRSLEKETRESSEVLRAVDRHIDINWVALTGERQKIALDLKNRVREEVERNDKLERRLHRSDILLDSVALRARRRLALKDASAILPSRIQTESALPLYRRIDILRTRIMKSFQNERRGFSDFERQLEKEVADKERKLRAARETLLTRARNDIRTTMMREREEIVGMLRKYRWASADARYRLLRATEKGLADTRRRAELESTDLEKRYEEFSTPPAASFPFAASEVSSSNPLFQERLKDLAYFRSRARAYSEEILHRIAEKTKQDRVRYTKQHLREEAQALDDRAKSREDAIFGYQLYLGDDPKSSQTPYALYRSAQLQLERAESEKELGKTAEQSAEIRRYNYEMSVTPLDRLRKEFPAFEHRDAALYLLGYAFLDVGRESDSVSTFEQLLRESPRSRLAPEVQLRIGEYYFRQRKFLKAMPHYQDVLTFGFNYFYDKALYKLAWANYMLGRYDSAIAHFLILLDYSSELSVEDRARFVEFADEATEYVAFSMYRAGAASTAERIFTKTGWKPYTLEVLLRMGRIASDRGERDKSLSIYTLAAREFPLSSSMPEIAAAEIRLLEELKQDDRVVLQMAAAYHLFARDGEWWKKHSEDRHALGEADALMQRVLLSLASRYEAGRKPDRAAQVYADLVARFPESSEAYEATFRLGELAFGKRDYSGAIQEYDRLAKSGRFNDHFYDALFGTVASREKIVAGKGGIETLAAKSGALPPPEATDLTTAIDNFAKRAPMDPRVPEALFRKAVVHEKLRSFDRAREAYLDVATKYPKSAWRDEALVASVNVLVANEKWPEAAAAASELLQRYPDATPDARKRLTTLAEGSRFKEAETLSAEGDGRKAVTCFLKFQTDFPKSALAPKALFNAFAVGKKEGFFAPASDALEKLLLEYPRSAESVSIRFEQAILHDALFEFAEAKVKYEEALTNGLSKDRQRTALVNLSTIARGNARKRSDLEKIFAYTARLDGASAGQILSDTGTAAMDLNEMAFALKVYSEMIDSPRYPPRHRAEAAGTAALILWKSGKTERAMAAERAALDFLRKVSTNDRGRVSAKIAPSLARHVSYDRARMQKSRLSTRSEKDLAFSFKKKAKSLQELEKSVLNLLRFPSLLSGASGLYDLGLAYRDFVTELEAIPSPAEGKEDFNKTIVSLTSPLKNKSIEALSRAQKILWDERLPAPFYDDLINQLHALGVKTPPKLSDEAVWAERSSPEMPQMLRTSPGSAPVSFRGWIPLAAFIGLKKTDAVIEMERGIAELHNAGSQGDRKKAIQAFGKALSLDPTLVQAAFNLAIVQLLDGERSSAAGLIQSLALKIDESDLETLRALYSLLYDDVPTARTHLEKIIEKRPHDLFALGELALLDLENGNAEAALEKARACLRENPRSVFAHEVLGLAFQKTNRRLMAHIAFERAFAISPESPSLNSSLALFLDPDRDLELRATLFKAAAEKQGPEGRANWARLAYETWNGATACKEWHEVDVAPGKKLSAILKNLRICSQIKEGNAP